VCGKCLNIVSMCAVSPVVHTSNISSCKKKCFQFSCGCEQYHYGRFFGVLVINGCSHGEHYETPCIIVNVIIPSLQQQRVKSSAPLSSSLSGRFFGFLVINGCNHGEHYETPCIIVNVIIPSLQQQRVKSSAPLSTSLSGRLSRLEQIFTNPKVTGNQ
jgi:hypothetical protein